MTRKSLGLDYLDHVFNAERSIFRLEQQPIYAADLDPRYWPDYEAWLRQSPRHVDETDAVWGDWIIRTRQLADRGIPLARLRVMDDPPTDYQRWSAFTAMHLNNPNGEDIRYLARGAAAEVGISTDDGDWWLIDGSSVLLMHFGTDGLLHEVQFEDRHGTVQRARDVQDRSRKASVSPEVVLRSWIGGRGGE
ncbi:MAG: DUF6879 family protein [Actinomycetota bacterium]